MAARSVGRAIWLFVEWTDLAGREASPPLALGTRVNRDEKPEDEEQPSSAASASIAPTWNGRNQIVSLSSIGWRRGGTFCEGTPLLDPLPAPVSQGEEENARSKNFAEKNKVSMDANATRFQRFNTRLIVRKGCVDSSKIRSKAPKFAAVQPIRQTGLARRVPPRHSAP